MAPLASRARPRAVDGEVRGVRDALCRQKPRYLLRHVVPRASSPTCRVHPAVPALRGRHAAGRTQLDSRDQARRLSHHKDEEPERAGGETGS